MTEKKPFPENLSLEAILVLSFFGLPTALLGLIALSVYIIGELA